MVMVPVDYLGVLINAILSMVLGFLWYGPLFGKKWIKLSSLKSDNSKASGSVMARMYTLMFIGALLMAFILDHALIFASVYLKIYGISAGLMVGFVNWLGFIAPVTLNEVLAGNKSFRLWLINAGYYLILLLVMGIVFSLL